jgi:hypothetical protein
MSTLLLLVLASAGAPPADPAGARPAAERKVCKTETPIGSLAARRRVCHSAAEWREIAERARDSYRDLQGAQGSTHSVEPDLARPAVPQ